VLDPTIIMVKEKHLVCTIKKVKESRLRLDKARIKDSRYVDERKLKACRLVAAGEAVNVDALYKKTTGKDPYKVTRLDKIKSICSCQIEDIDWEPGILVPKIKNI
jgi:hypothetical protein